MASIDQSLLTSAPTQVLIALGSNQGDPVATVLEAMKRLDGLCLQTALHSSLWQSSPVDCPPGSPLFVNAAVAFPPLPHETPESLLEKLQTLEKEFGRPSKRIHNEPRLLDLDLIAFGAEVRATPLLTLPHPRAHLRRFVLEPLNEIAPELVLPGQPKSIRQFLAGLRTDEIVTRL